MSAVNIPLMTQTPAPFNPMQTIGAIMQMKNAGADVALRQAQARQADQQTADIQAQAAQRNRELQSYNNIQQKLQDPAVQQKIGQEDYSDLYSVADPKTADAVTASLQKMHQTAQTLRTGQAAYHAEGRSKLQSILEGLDPKDDATAASQFNAARQSLGVDYPDLAAAIPQIQPGPDFRQKIQDMAASNGVARSILENSAKLQGVQADTAQKQASTNEAIAKTPGAQATSDIAVMRANAMKNMTPKSVSDLVDRIIPAKNPYYAEQNATAKEEALAGLQAGSTPEDVLKIIDAGASRISQMNSGVEAARQKAPISVSVNTQEAANKPLQMMVPNGQGGYSVKSLGPGDTIPAGAVSQSGMSSMNVPTANTRSMAEKAPRVIQFVDRINQLLDANEKQLGPLNSRWDEFTAGKVGIPNQGYTQLRTDAGLLQTALMNMHVGARGGGQIMEHFKDLIDVSKQSPENLRAALGEIRDYAQTVQREGQTNQPPITAGTGGTITVRRKSDGQIGTMPAANFNPQLYDKQ